MLAWSFCFDRIRPLKRFPPATWLLPLLLFVFATTEDCKAYVLEGPTWPRGSTVIMRLGLGPTPVALQDGLASWNASAADALAIWNGYLDFIHITSASTPAVPQRIGDRYNSVFFSSTIFGDSFGANTIAVTVLQGPGSTPTVIGEADVIINSAHRYNSYRGPLHFDARGPIFDLHRIFLHEFGHVLGLDHDTTYPLKTKIMEPIISDWDHLGADDIAGLQSLYGASFYDPGRHVPPSARTSLYR
jgi:matrixin